MQSNTDIRRVVKAIHQQEQSDVAAFIAEWTTTTKKDKYLRKIDASVQLLAQAYSAELDRLLGGHPPSTEWIQVLESVQLLRAAVMDRLEKSPTLTSLPLSDPQTLADRTYGFLVDAMYQFGSSVGAAKKQQSPAA